MDIESNAVRLSTGAFKEVAGAAERVVRERSGDIGKLPRITVLVQGCGHGERHIDPRRQARSGQHLGDVGSVKLNTALQPIKTQGVSDRACEDERSGMAAGGRRRAIRNRGIVQQVHALPADDEPDRCAVIGPLGGDHDRLVGGGRAEHDVVQFDVQPRAAGGREDEVAIMQGERGDAWQRGADGRRDTAGVCRSCVGPKPPVAPAVGIALQHDRRRVHRHRGEVQPARQQRQERKLRNQGTQRGHFDLAGARSIRQVNVAEFEDN